MHVLHGNDRDRTPASFVSEVCGVVGDEYRVLHYCMEGKYLNYVRQKYFPIYIASYATKTYQLSTISSLILPL